MATGGETRKKTFEIPKERSFDELSRITNNFSDDRKLGKSQFGTLYKGVTEGGDVIAVKKLVDHVELVHQLKKEAQKLMALKHQNVVRLVGFCSEPQQKLVPSGDKYDDIADITANLLCYEYFPDGNLADYLFGTEPSKDIPGDPVTKEKNEFSSDEQGRQSTEDISSAEPGTSKPADDIASAETSKKLAEDKTSSLDISSAEAGTSKASNDSSSSEASINWDKRFTIINGICDGLLFLHSLDSPIIHLDLKLQNIWLGAEMVPKIGNFGISRLFDTGISKISTKLVVGSYGHIAPEYFFQGEISPMADIYNLGLLIIEITTGEKNYPNTKDPTARKYIEKIQTAWTAEHIASEYSSLNAERLQQVYACIEIGLQCVELDQTKRPHVAKIVDRLNTI